jgi:hypothetical protein
MIEGNRQPYSTPYPPSAEALVNLSNSASREITTLLEKIKYDGYGMALGGGLMLAGDYIAHNYSHSLGGRLIGKSVEQVGRGIGAWSAVKAAVHGIRILDRFDIYNRAESAIESKLTV